DELKYVKYAKPQSHHVDMMSVLKVLYQPRCHPGQLTVFQNYGVQPNSSRIALEHNVHKTNQISLES
ncbi:hypothetical protein TNCV_1022441, partial [Trichonephila clavipes]